MGTKTAIPVLEMHNGICVVRDDLYEGGTKARIFDYLYSKHNEIVYACAAFSKTQVSLARVAKRLGKKATIFLPKRGIVTPETVHAKVYGADIHEVKPGYMNVVIKRAAEYAHHYKAYLPPLGFDTPEVIKLLADIARGVPYDPQEVWCAAGSGVLSRSLQFAWPDAAHVAVQVGKDCNVGKAEKLFYHLPLEDECKGETPFPSDKHYDAKAWQVCNRAHTPGKRVLFWNVLA